MSHSAIKFLQHRSSPKTEPSVNHAIWKRDKRYHESVENFTWRFSNYYSLKKNLKMFRGALGVTHLLTKNSTKNEGNCRDQIYVRTSTPRLAAAITYYSFSSFHCPILLHIHCDDFCFTFLSRYFFTSTFSKFWFYSICCFFLLSGCFTRAF